MMKRVSLLGMMLVMLLALIAGALPALAQDPCYDRGGFEDENGRCVIRGGFDLTLHYPTELSQYPEVDEVMDKFFIEQREMFTDAYFAMLDEPVMFTTMPWSLNIDYELTGYQGSITTVSIVFTINDYTGGAHPNLYYRTFMFELPGGREITLSDLFDDEQAALEQIAPMVQESLREQLGDMAELSWIEEGAAPDPVNYQNFALTTSALNFYFPPYQVAAYAAGPYMVELPLGDVIDLLAFE